MEFSSYSWSSRKEYISCGRVPFLTQLQDTGAFSRLLLHFISWKTLFLSALNEPIRDTLPFYRVAVDKEQVLEMRTLGEYSIHTGLQILGAVRTEIWNTWEIH